MLPAVQPIPRNVPGYGSDGRRLLCSGVAGRVVSISPCSSGSDYKSFPLVKIIPLTCASRGGTSSICNANSGGQRRNPHFSRQNRHVYSRNRNRQNEERDDSNNLEESEIFSPKNGPLLSGSGSPRFQATGIPGPREKEIVELFRMVRDQLRERAVIKEEKAEDPQGQSKQKETVDSLLELLKKHSVQKEKRSNSNGSSRDFILDQPEQNGPLFEEKRPTFFDSNNTVKHGVQENKAQSVSKPISKFQRRSPVPQSNYQPIDSDEDTVHSNPFTNVDGKRKEISLEPEPEHEPMLKFNVVEAEPETESELEVDSIFSGGGVFDEISDDETSEIDDDDSEEHNLIESRDLSGMKLPELRALAKSRGIKGFSKLKKRELMELLVSSSI